jgi:hypothetical protein
MVGPTSKRHQPTEGLNMVYRFIILLMMSWLAGGCLTGAAHRYYDFTSPEAVIDAKDMLIGARLIGRELPEKKKVAAAALQGTRGGSPYMLSIYVIARTGFYRSARIADIELLGADKRRVPIPDSVRQAVAPFEDRMARYWAVLTIPDLDLAYEPQLLTATIEITTQANSTIRQEIQLPFEPTYGEKKTDDAWTRMMNR